MDNSAKRNVSQDDANPENKFQYFNELSEYYKAINILLASYSSAGSTQYIFNNTQQRLGKNADGLD